MFGIIYGLTADGFTPARAARLRRGHPVALLQVPDVSKIELLGAQDETIFIEFSTKQLAGLGLDQSAFVAALRAQNVVLPSGTHPDRRRDARAARHGRLRLGSRPPQRQLRRRTAA